MQGNQEVYHKLPRVEEKTVFKCITSCFWEWQKHLKKQVTDKNTHGHTHVFAQLSTLLNLNKVVSPMSRVQDGSSWLMESGFFIQLLQDLMVLLLTSQGVCSSCC